MAISSSVHSNRSTTHSRVYRIKDNDYLQARAENRASAARNWLVKKGEISSERIFVVGIDETERNDQKKDS